MTTKTHLKSCEETNVTTRSSKTITRRQFLRRNAGVGVGLLVPAIWTPNGLASPNERLNIAVIGVGGQGRSNLNSLSREAIVALCDVDDERAGDAYAKFPQAKKYYDFRKMLDEMDAQIDAVVVNTPDHTHAHAALMAMRMGKHCYCEKPMAHAIAEVRAMTELAREKKLATQLGVQRHTIGNIHRVVEIVQSGAIGEVREVVSWQGGNRGMPAMPTEFPPVPAHLQWDLWLGPADERPYSPAYCPYNWRFWWDFGTGETGNWGCHVLDIPFWALKLATPTKVSASGPPIDPQRTSKSMFTRMEFPVRETLPPVTLHWCHSDQQHPLLKENNLPNWGNNLFVGSKGMLLCDFNKRKLFPEDRFADFEEPAKTIPDSPGFHREWVNACKGSEPATCNFDYSGPMTETVLLGNLAYRVGQEFAWDAKAMKAVGCPQAEPFIRPTYRKGWPL
ncbi:MAG: gfo/Idh/MocA family oxidoreductase [Candidatus Omnitrophota bacterium]|jgi:predicted dehydrogenase|nr:MAG: gfo/Idh/MocA family oxidoreductase [Candidatus Omnitrophota bacterium]